MSLEKDAEDLRDAMKGLGTIAKECVYLLAKVAAASEFFV